MSITIASNLNEALQAMAAGARPIAGGTDLVVGSRQGKAPLPQQLVAIDRILELTNITQTNDRLTIGAGVTHAMLMEHSVIVEQATSIADASALVGSPATRNVGTLGGNVMNGSPAMDTGAPLVVLDAVAHLRSSENERAVTLQELWTGPGQTSAQPDELCVALSMPTPIAGSGSAYVRLEYRRAMEIAVVGAAAWASVANGVVTAARIALTAVAPTILTITGTESLVGLRPQDAAEAAKEMGETQAAPISDLRASDSYRRHTVGVMAARALDAAIRRASGEHIAVPVNRAEGVGAAQ